MKKRDHSELVRKLDRDGIKDKAERFLQEYPESPDNLTYRELREQIHFYI